MRRFASVFATKRDKHVPPPLVTDHHAHSSASDSSGSASVYLHTPDDDHHPIDSNSSKKSWKSWLKSPPKQPPKLWHNPVPDWAPQLELDDTQSEPSVDDHLPPQDLRQTFYTLVENSLIPSPVHPSPFTRRSDASLVFPRSIHHSSTLTRAPSLALTVLKSRLLARLNDGDRPFTQAEQLTIAGLASRRISSVVPLNPPPHPFNESAPSRTTMITFTSPGLSRWISRPCFEDRYAVYLLQPDSSISRHPVTGTALAVAAIEYSEALEAMVDFDLHDDSLPPSSSLVIEIPSSASEPVSTLTSSSGHARNSPYMAVPSPLRNEHNLPVPPPVNVTQSAPTTVSAPAPAAAAAASEPLVKRGVRFAEDNKDDVIPLGYVLRMKKKREEKAKFLRAEHERRLLEEERMRLEEERRVNEAKRAELENDRMIWEREKRAMEEEKRQRKYAEEVVAARLRRESQRAGGVPALKASENNANAFLGSSAGGAAGYFPASATSSASERNKPPPARRHSRPPLSDDGGPLIYPPRREASEPNLPTITRTSPNAASVPITHSQRGSSHSHSPGSSRPPSLRGTPPSNESSSPLPGTRSPSVYSSQEVSSSSEDVKAAVAAAASRTKRRSFAMTMSHNNSSTSLAGDRATSFPVWGGSNHSLNSMIPPVPMIPMQMQVPMMPMPAFVMMDMPLLPPTPPFMMQQYPRQHGSPGSSGSGAGSSKGRLSSSHNSSRERVNQVGGGGGAEGSRSGHPPRSASFPRPDYRHTSSSPAAPPKSPRHSHTQGSASGEARRASLPVSPPRQPQHQSPRPRQYSHHEQRPSPPTHSHSQPSSMSRGTSAQHLHPPNPWTGVPTQSGKLPNANVVPPRQHAQSSPRSSAKAKRQTMIS